jgi:hypothetical protein
MDKIQCVSCAGRGMITCGSCEGNRVIYAERKELHP